MLRRQWIPHNAAWASTGLVRSELIRRTLADARSRPGVLVGCGAGTDHLERGTVRTLEDVIAAYETQIEAIEKLDGRIILMASRALVEVAKGPDDYQHVYDRILRQVRHPVVIHWLGEMFDPALEGYWGADNHLEAMEVALSVIAANAAKVEGIKISLLSKEKEIIMGGGGGGGGGAEVVGGGATCVCHAKKPP